VQRVSRDPVGPDRTTHADGATRPTTTPASTTTPSPTRTGLTIAIIAVVAGAIAGFSGASPTGNPTIDVVLTATTVGGTTWLGAAALRWDAALISLVAAATAWTIVGAAIAVTNAAVGYTFPVRPAHRHVVTAVMVAVALNVAARSHLGGFLGLSTIVFVGLAVFIGAIGTRRRTRAVRRTVLAVAVTAAVLTAAGTAAVAATGLLAAGDLRDADAHARSGLDALRDGELDAARAAFDDASTSFRRANDRTATPVTAVARFVPGLAQHHRVATELTVAGADATAVLAARLGEVDLAALSDENGRIDVRAVRDLRPPLHAVGQQIEALHETITDVDSQWLLPPVTDRLTDLAAEVDEQRRRSDDALAGAIAAPDLLGGEGPRTYFIGFTTPSEARGLGGFMGNWAEITITDGRIEMTRFGRTDELNEAGDPTRRFTTGAGSDDPGLEEWLTRYGAYNLSSGPGGTTGPAVWKNINMSPDMATTGRAIADLYPQSGGGELDGVFVMDVHALTRLLQFTGPIPLPDDATTADGRNVVTADTAAEFLLHDQYDIAEKFERVDALEEFSTAVVDRLLGAPLPSPIDLIDALGPMVDQGRLTGWAARGSEQDLFARIGLSGTLPAPDGDGLAITFNNAAGSKIDYFLAAEASYTVTADAATNTAAAQLVVSLTNTAPSAGEPDYVIGNLIGLPDGSNRTWVSIYSRLPVTDVRLGDRPAAVEIGREAGYFVTSAFVTIAPGATTTLSVQLDGRLDVTDGYDLAVRSPPTVAPTPVRVEATWTGGDGRTRRVAERFPDAGVHRISVEAE
jgi:hypothetical protein